MDWTGGVRRRFAGKQNKSLTQKQKAHFAKARAALQDHPASQPSLVPEFARNKIPPARDRFKQHSEPHHGSGCREDRPTSSDYGAPYAGVRASSTLDLPTKHKRPDNIRLNHPPVMDTEEDRLLLAKRKRLLARGDWLDLAAKRRIQMQFDSSQGKDKVGKRRKINRTARSRATLEAQHWSISPFQSPHLLQGHTQSPFCQLGDIQVRIGPQALRSRTGRSCGSSRRSPSRRSESTDFGSLSEEPMLLGTEWDDHREIIPQERCNVEGMPTVPNFDSRPGSAFRVLRRQSSLGGFSKQSRDRNGSFSFHSTMQIEQNAEFASDVVEKDDSDSLRIGSDYGTRILDIDPRILMDVSLEMPKSPKAQPPSSTGTQRPIVPHHRHWRLEDVPCSPEIDGRSASNCEEPGNSHDGRWNRTAQLEKVDNDEALWRPFIIGLP